MDRMRPPSRPRPAFWQHRATHRAAGAAEGMLCVWLGASAAGTNRKPSRIPQRPTAEHPAKRRLGAPAGSVCPLCFTPILQILSSCQESGVRRGTSPRMPKEQRKGRLLQPASSRRAGMTSFGHTRISQFHCGRAPFVVTFLPVRILRRPFRRSARHHTETTT